jgi:alkaline phosphatase
MGIGYKTTNYDTFLTNLTHQKMSYAKFDSTYVQNYIANKTPFEAAMQDVKANFGLTLPTDPDAANAGKLLLTDYEVQNLRTAYERTLKVGSASQKDMSQQDYELYGTYIPFSMAICHTINHKSGMDHTTYAHTGAMVNLYARGQGADKFRGVYDNTEIFHKLAELTDVQ